MEGVATAVCIEGLRSAGSVSKRSGWGRDDFPSSSGPGFEVQLSPPCLPARALFSASALSSSPLPVAASTSIRRSPAFELELPAATREGKSSSCSAGAPAALPSHQVMCSQSHICDRFEIFNIWKIFSCQLHTVHIIHLFTPRTPPCQMTLVQNKVRSGLL